MDFTHFRQLGGFYFFYFAFVGAFASYWSLYLKSLSFSALQISFALSVMQVMRIISPTIWGWIADHRSNPQTVVRALSVATIILFSGVFFSDKYFWLVPVTACASFVWGGSLPLVEAITMGQLAGQTDRYGRIRLWGSVGFILAVTIVGYLLDHVAMRWLPHIVVLMMLGIAWFAFKIPDAVAHHSEHSSEPIWNILRRREVMLLFAACFCMTAAHGPLYIFFSIFLDDHGYNKTSIGVLWSLGVIVEVFLFLYFPKIVKVIRLEYIFIGSFAVAAVRFLMIAWGVQWPALIVIAQVLHAITFGAFHVAAMTYVHRHFQGRHQAKGQALFTSLTYGAGGTVGGLVAGALWEPIGSGLTFSLGALTAALGFILLWANRALLEQK